MAKRSAISGVKPKRSVKRTKPKDTVKALEELHEVSALAEGAGELGQADDDKEEGSSSSMKSQNARRRKGADGDAYDESSGQKRKIGGRGDLATDLAIDTELGGHGNSDGYEESDQAQREVYEQYLKGVLKEDIDKRERLKYDGHIDSFDPHAAAWEIELKGPFKAADHLVRLYDHWLADGVDRHQALHKAAEWLDGFRTQGSVRKVIAELENKPIRDVYPIELMKHLIDNRPELVAGVKKAELCSALDVFSASAEHQAGQKIRIDLPENMRIKGIALHGGLRPGYEFYPSPEHNGYDLIVDTPGEWNFSIFAVHTKRVGRVVRELPGGVFDNFRVRVVAKKKTEQAQRAFEAQNSSQTGVSRLKEYASLWNQVEQALSQIQRDDDGIGRPSYSWQVQIYPSGRFKDDQKPKPLWSIALDHVSAFDPAWEQSCDALNMILKKNGFNNIVEMEDIRNAIRLARKSKVSE